MRQMANWTGRAAYSAIYTSVIWPKISLLEGKWGTIPKMAKNCPEIPPAILLQISTESDL